MRSNTRMSTFLMHAPLHYLWVKSYNANLYIGCNGNYIVKFGLELVSRLARMYGIFRIVSYMVWVRTGSRFRLRPSKALHDDGSPCKVWSCPHSYQRGVSTEFAPALFATICHFEGVSCSGPGTRWNLVPSAHMETRNLPESRWELGLCVMSWCLVYLYIWFTMQPPRPRYYRCRGVWHVRGVW